MNSIMLCALALVSPVYSPKLDAEKSIVLTRTFEMARTDGGKPLEIRVVFPDGKTSSLPVIVWSHGMYGSRSGYDPLVKTWAQAGYVVIQPTHLDSLEYMSREEKTQLLRTPNVDRTQSWNTRPVDVHQCFDLVNGLEANIPELMGRVDESKVGMGGHSFGAWTTQVAAGMTLPTQKDAAEKRAKCFVVISPHGASDQPGDAMRKQNLKPMRGPMLMITGTNDEVTKGQGAAWRSGAYDHTSAKPLYFQFIEGATHGFGGISGVDRAANKVLPGRLRDAFGTGDRDKPEHLRLVKQSTLAFWDAHLKGMPAAKDYLVEKPWTATKGMSWKWK
jgi:dienelactone hydrolase